jgi:4-aminobutyrate aminotransferase-like enzyme
VTEAASVARDISKSEEILSREASCVGDCMKIRFYPFVAAAAQGSRMFDVDVNEYLDFLSCGGVVQTGFHDKDVERAVVAEIEVLGTTNHCVYPGTSAVLLAERLCDLLPGPFEKKAWFGCTG